MTDTQTMPNELNGPRIGRDPVCGMVVEPTTAKHYEDHAGENYFFCSAGCRAKFLADPAKYLAQNDMAHPAHHHDDAAPISAPADADAIYTCPMHPPIRHNGPRH